MYKYCEKKFIESAYTVQEVDSEGDSEDELAYVNTTDSERR